MEINIYKIKLYINKYLKIILTKKKYILSYYLY